MNKQQVLKKDLEVKLCGAVMSGKDQHGNPIHCGPCILSAGHVEDDGRPSFHTDMKSNWGGDS